MPGMPGTPAKPRHIPGFPGIPGTHSRIPRHHPGTIPACPGTPATSMISRHLLLTLPGYPGNTQAHSRLARVPRQHPRFPGTSYLLSPGTPATPRHIPGLPMYPGNIQAFPGALPGYPGSPPPAGPASPMPRHIPKVKNNDAKLQISQSAHVGNPLQIS
jgi:hypothetical protein